MPDTLSQQQSLRVDHGLGSTVYLVTDPRQLPRLVARIIIVPGGILYGVVQETADSEHYGFELSAERNALLALGVSGSDDE
jgi:hypothetical protein